MKRLAIAAIRERIALKSKSHKRQKKYTVASYWEAVSCLLETYKMDDIIAGTDADMVQFPQQSNKSLTEYVGGQENKALKWARVYDE